jgi:LysM repeat protein
MAFGELFKLAKLTIEACKDSKRADKCGAPLEVQYNPETLAFKYETVFQNKQGIATSSAQARFSHSRSKQLDVKLMFDGTEVGYYDAQPSVAERVQTFFDVCYWLNGTIHEPAYLRLSWGRLPLGDKGKLATGFDCRLQSADIKYTALNRDGSPLQAELDAVFVEDIDPKKKATLDKLTSPDLSHRRVVKSGDTLPLLCREIYGSAEHYPRIAEVNGLDDFRLLIPGRELIFPPFEPAGGT